MVITNVDIIEKNIFKY